MTKGKTRDEIAEAYSSEPWWYDIRGFFILTFAYNSTINTSRNRISASALLPPATKSCEFKAGNNWNVAARKPVEK